MLLSGIVALVASLALFTEINLLWILADFLLTGRLPYFETSIGFLGSVIVLSAVGVMIGRIFYDARTDLYKGAVEKSKIKSSPSKISIAEALTDEEETDNEITAEDELEEAIA